MELGLPERIYRCVLPPKILQTQRYKLTSVSLSDFDDPPPPPSDLWASDFVTQSGTFKPPRPANELKRQRAVDGLGILSPSLEADLPTPPRSPTRATGDEIGSANSREQNQAFDSEPANRRDGGSPEGSVAGRRDSLKGSTKRQLGPLHPALQQLAAEAKQRFGVDATTVSLMSNDHQVFLSDSACKFIEDTDRLERDSMSTRGRVILRGFRKKALTESLA